MKHVRETLAANKSAETVSEEAGFRAWVSAAVSSGKVPLAGYWLLLTYLLLAPSPLWFLGDYSTSVDATVTKGASPYVQHVIAYGLLSMLLVWTWRAKPAAVAWRWALIAAAHGMAMEWLQQFVPSRFGDWRDALANLVGVAAGWLLGRMLLYVGWMSSWLPTESTSGTKSFSESSEVS